jgi:hypothetical protein
MALRAKLGIRDEFERIETETEQRCFARVETNAATTGRGASSCPSRPVEREFVHSFSILPHRDGLGRIEPAVNARFSCA